MQVGLAMMPGLLSRSSWVILGYEASLVGESWERQEDEAFFPADFAWDVVIPGREGKVLCTGFPGNFLFWH